jgi:enterobactin synthetase component F
MAPIPITGVSTLSDPNLLPTERPFATELPLVAAQPGIWVADQISPHANAYAVSHYIELNGPLDQACLLRAIEQGLSEVDTLQFRFEERDGVPMQWHDPELAILPVEYIDLRESPDAAAAARALMQLDMSGDLRIGSGNALYRHMLIRLSEQRWFWYQRYHHISGRWLQFYRHCPQNRPYLHPDVAQ